MTDNTVEAFVEAILDNKRPKHFKPSSDDIGILRLVLQLRTSQGERARPDPQFVEELHRRLALTATNGAELIPLTARGGPGIGRALPNPWEGSSRRKTPRRFALLSKAAAAFVLVAGTFSATNLVTGHSAAPAARASNASVVRSGVLLTAEGRPLGQTYAYSGNPSWVFMDVQGSALSGTYTCELHLANGSTIPAGLVVVYNGTGDWAHTVKIAVNQLREATLVTSTGVTVASATFS